MTAHAVAQKIVEAGVRARGGDANAETFIDILGAVGRYSAVADAIAGHTDHFGYAARRAASRFACPGVPRALCPS